MIVLLSFSIAYFSSNATTSYSPDSGILKRSRTCDSNFLWIWVGAVTEIRSHDENCIPTQRNELSLHPHEIIRARRQRKAANGLQQLRTDFETTHHEAMQLALRPLSEDLAFHFWGLYDVVCPSFG